MDKKKDYAKGTKKLKKSTETVQKVWIGKKSGRKKDDREAPLVVADSTCAFN